MFAPDTVVEIANGLYANSSNGLGTKNVLMRENQIK